MSSSTAVRVVLPHHLRTLAGTGREVTLALTPPVTVRSVLDELETRYPVLRGTIREHSGGQRRPFVRFFACKEDLSNDDPDTELSQAVTEGSEPFLVVGAMAGG